MIRKCVTFHGTTFLAAVAVQNADFASDSKNQEQRNDLAHYQCKSTELPLYTPLHFYNKPQKKCHTPKSSVRDVIETNVRAVRVEVQKGCQLIDKQKDTFVEYVHQITEKAQSAVDYLNQPHNLLPRTGAIVMGGLSGFIFAARRGFIKKILYTTLGAGAIASLCYPRQAEQFAQETLFEARKGYVIAYNFVKGVKRGDEASVEPISNFPTTLEDVKFLATDLYEEAKEALFPKKK